MKQKWSEPTINTLGVQGTKDESNTLDAGHGYDHFAHSHHCTCGLTFPTWKEAQAHELEMTLAGKSEEHNIGCKIIIS